MTKRMTNFKLISVCVAVALISIFALAGCSATYAAKVNGTEIKEEKITKYIQQIRESYSMTDADSWGKYLAQVSMTPSSIRDQILDTYIEQEIVKQFAGEKNCEATQEEIDKQVSKVREYYADDSAWEEALKSAGFESEADYRDILKYSIAYEKLGKALAKEATVSDETVLSNIQSRMDTLDGGKKSSHILFNSNDEATAKEVLEKIKSGELDFAEAAKQYSQDTSSAEDGGNVGWDKDTSFVEAYTNALNGLGKGEVSDLVTSDYGIHIIKCTNEFHKPEKTDSLSDFDADFVEDMRDEAKETQGTTDLTNWIDEKKNSSTIEKKDMPSDVSYNVDMSKYESSSSSTDSSTDSSTSTDSSNSNSSTSTDSSSTDSSASTDSSSTNSSSTDSQSSTENTQNSNGTQSSDTKQSQ